MSLVPGLSAFERLGAFRLSACARSVGLAVYAGCLQTLHACCSTRSPQRQCISAVGHVAARLPVGGLGQH